MKYTIVFLLLLALSLQSCSEKTTDLSEDVPEFVERGQSTKIPTIENKVPDTEKTLPCNFFDEYYFGANIVKVTHYEDGDKLFAATAPHYNPVLYLGASVLSSIREPDTIIVIGPDHYGRNKRIIVTSLPWNTPFGVLKGNAVFSNLFLKNKTVDAETDDEAMQKDHAVSVYTPYIKHYFPNTSVIGILIGKSVAKQRLDEISKEIFAYSKGKKVFVLASVDFSHYQTPDAANAFDRETVDAILSGNISNLLKMNAEHLDSPECIAVVDGLSQLYSGKAKLTDNKTLIYPENGILNAGSYMVFTYGKVKRG